VLPWAADHEEVIRVLLTSLLIVVSYLFAGTLWHRLFALDSPFGPKFVDGEVITRWPYLLHYMLALVFVPVGYLELWVMLWFPMFALAIWNRDWKIVLVTFRHPTFVVKAFRMAAKEGADL
jgi:hypothetical protein